MGEPIKFPSQAIHVPAPVGNEPIFATRASDGEVIYFTPNELLSALLKLKTINGIPIVGVGNIPVASNETAATIIQKLSVAPANNVAFLPQIDLMPLFNNTQFAVVGGKITYLGGTVTPPVQLATPVLSLYGSNTDTQIGSQWLAIANATGYDIYREISGVKTKVGTTAGLNYINTGLAASTQYTFYIKAITTTSGYASSDFSNPLTSSTAAATGLPTPIAPTVVVDATARTIKFTQATYPNGMEYRVNGGAWTNYVANTAIAIGDNAVAANYYEGRVKEVAGVNNVGVIAGNAAIAAKDTGVTYTPVDTQWQFANGGVTRNSNTITYTDNSRAITTLTLHAGVAGSVQFGSSDAALILSTNASNYDGFSESMYGATRNPINLKIQAFSHTSSDVNIETGGITPAPVITINITTTGGSGGIGEVIWLHGVTEWARDSRVAGDFTIKSFGYTDGVLSTIVQNGFV